MGLILPIRNRGFATCADDALHPGFWEPHRPVSLFAPRLGRTGNQLIDYADNKEFLISGYASNMWRNPLDFSGATNMQAARANNIDFTKFNALTVHTTITLGTIAYQIISENGITYTNDSYYLFLNLNAYFEFYVRNVSAGFVSKTAVGTANAGETYALTGRWKSGIGSEILLNGIDRTAIQSGTVPSVLQNGDVGITIGRRPSTTAYSFDGQIATHYVWPTYLRDDLMRILVADPLAPFRKRPIRRYYYFAHPQTQTLDQASIEFTAYEFNGHQTTTLNQATVEFTAYEFNGVQESGDSITETLDQATAEFTAYEFHAIRQRKTRLAGYLDRTIPHIRNQFRETMLEVFGATMECVIDSVSRTNDLGIGGRTDGRTMRVTVREVDLPDFLTIDDTGFTIDSDTETIDLYGYNPRSGNKIVIDDENWRIAKVTKSGCLGHYIFDCESDNR